MSDGAGEGCRLCPRQCGAKRTPEAGGGFCGMGTDPVIGRAALHRWEEPCISGTRGSGAVFFAGCTLLCRFCQNYELSRGRAGRRVSVRHLSEIFRRLEGEGAHNLNLVTATPFIPAVLSALEWYRPKIPVVFNCGGYERPETLRRLSGAVDVYLPDFKYWSGRMAALLSGAGDYPERAKEAIREMVRQTGAPVYDAEGLMQRGTLVRHLVLPGLTADAMRILKKMARAGQLDGDIVEDIDTCYLLHSSDMDVRGKKPLAEEGDYPGAAWRCPVCGYVYLGENPQETICPQCKQPGSIFEKI